MTKEQAKKNIENFLKLQESYYSDESEKMIEEIYNEIKRKKNVK